MVGDNSAKGIENVDEVIKKKIEEALLKVQNDTLIKLNGETYNRFSQAFKKLVKILETKTTIHPAITAPKEEQRTYLDRLSEIDSLTNKIQFLEAPAASDDNVESVQDSQEKEYEKDSES